MNIKKFFSLAFVGFIITGFAYAQTICTLKDREKTVGLLEKAKENNWHEKSVSELAILVGKEWLGLPYVAKTLEKGEKEQLVVNLRELDCTTFLENVVVFTRLIQQQKYTFENLEKELTHIRYRGGTRQEYPSRLHYFTDWMYDSQKKGLIDVVTKSAGGVPYKLAVGFMSSHADLYAQLKDGKFVPAIREKELEINQREILYLPKGDIPANESNIKDGDLIAITTSIEGLDVSHVGIALHQNGRLHFFHASSLNKEVEITNIPLADYLAKGKKSTGIMVSRLKDMRNEAPKGN